METKWAYKLLMYLWSDLLLVLIMFLLLLPQPPHTSLHMLCMQELYDNVRGETTTKHSKKNLSTKREKNSDTSICCSKAKCSMIGECEQEHWRTNAWTATWSNSRKKQFEILNNSIVNSKYSPCKAKETRRVVRHLRDLDIKQFKQRLLFYCLLMLLGNRECAAPYTFTIANCDMIWNFIIAIKWYFFLLLIVSHTKCCSVLYIAQYYKESMINCCLLSSYSLQNGRFFLSIFRREYFATFHKYQAISKYRNWH